MTASTPTGVSLQETVNAKLDAVQRFLDLTADPLPDEPTLIEARTISERCADRMQLPLRFTTVALAGTTGSGKSSMFNAFTTIDRSPAGILRPTTSEPYACVWGSLALADELLDWLGVSRRRRFTRESALDADDEAALRGMILLDLPDVDSMEPKHRAEVDRLLHLVDIVVWITDPQKYGDQLVHEGYLRRLASRRSGLIVALNQTDKLLPAHLPKVGADLRQMLDEGDLAAVPLVATSATGMVPVPPQTRRAPIKQKPGPFSTERSRHGHPGVATLRALLEPNITKGTIAVETVDRDLSTMITKLAPLVGGTVTAPTTGPLVQALTAADGDKEEIDAAVREYADKAAAGLKGSWPDAVQRAATSRLGELPAALDQAIAHANAQRPRRTWLPGGRRRANARVDSLLQQEVEKVALRYVTEPARRVLAAHERAKAVLSELVQPNPAAA